ncbi:hypothetical protein [uncultured Luteimonas sp.]|uniref:hypothetical protein n=1 Tax=uncultured Luteimonas sp. TaxID=453144 RepID=UPI002622BFF9|nr:hypothetical protein [uncultured Luteimonas sp.]
MGRVIGKGVASAGLVLAMLGLVAALGLALCVLGLREGAAHLVFGGVMLVVLAGAGLLQQLAERPGRDGETPSLSEKASWQQLAVGMTAILVLGGVSLGSMQGLLSSWLFFAAYVVLVACYPLLRRRFIDANRRHRDIDGDERDRALRAQGDQVARRVLELSLLAIAVAWAVMPGLFTLSVEPVRLASLLLLPILLASVVGEARVAWLYWRDRQ